MKRWKEKQNNRTQAYLAILPSDKYLQWSAVKKVAHVRIHSSKRLREKEKYDKLESIEHWKKRKVSNNKAKLKKKTEKYSEKMEKKERNPILSTRTEIATNNYCLDEYIYVHTSIYIDMQAHIQIVYMQACGDNEKMKWMEENESETHTSKQTQTQRCTLTQVIQIQFTALFKDALYDVFETT